MPTGALRGAAHRLLHPDFLQSMLTGALRDTAYRLPNASSLLQPMRTGAPRDTAYRLRSRLLLQSVLAGVLRDAARRRLSPSLRRFRMAAAATCTGLTSREVFR